MSESVTTDPVATHVAATEPVIAPMAEPIAPDVVETPTEPAPVVVEPVIEAPAAPEAPVREPSLLELAGQEPGEPAPPEVVAPEVRTYEPFTFPEHITPDPTALGQFTSLLNERGLDQAAGQKLVDLYSETVKGLAEQTLANQWTAFAETQKTWQNRIMADERLGGPGFKTTSAAVARARDLLVPEADKAEFKEMLDATGVGNHPAFWRMLRNADNRMREPAVPSVQPIPLPNPGRAPRAGIRSIYKS